MSIFEGLIKPTLDSTINQELTMSMTHAPVTYNIDIKEIHVHVHVPNPDDTTPESTEPEQPINE